MLPRVSWLCAGDRQRHGRHRAAFRPVRQPHPPAVPGQDRADDGEAQPGAAGRAVARRVAADERLEQPVGQRRVDARGPRPRSATSASPSIDPPRDRRRAAIAQRIADQVGERAAELARVAAHDGARVPDRAPPPRRRPPCPAPGCRAGCRVRRSVESRAPASSRANPSTSPIIARISSISAIARSRARSGRCSTQKASRASGVPRSCAIAASIAVRDFGVIDQSVVHRPRPRRSARALRPGRRSETRAARAPARACSAAWASSRTGREIVRAIAQAGSGERDERRQHRRQRLPVPAQEPRRTRMSRPRASRSSVRHANRNRPTKASGIPGRLEARCRRTTSLPARRAAARASCARITGLARIGKPWCVVRARRLRRRAHRQHRSRLARAASRSASRARCSGRPRGGSPGGRAGEGDDEDDDRRQHHRGEHQREDRQDDRWRRPRVRARRFSAARRRP